MINYLIIDDEPIAHRIIEGYVQQLSFLQKKGACYDAFEALKFFNEETVDLVFLDINMPRLNGFDFLKTLSNKPSVIVTTAYQEYAIEGYELNVVDYLLKPFSFERFVKAVNKVPKNETTQVNHQIAASKEGGNMENKSLFLKGDKKHYHIKLDEILYLEAYGNYTKFHLKDRMLMTTAGLSSYEKELPKQLFIRVHKSFLIAILKIDVIEGNRIKIAEKEIPIGQTYKRNVYQLLK